LGAGRIGGGPKAFSRLEQLLPAWLFKMLQSWVDLLRNLDEKIQAAKSALANLFGSLTHCSTKDEKPRRHR
jgi:hypothetical protein